LRNQLINKISIDNNEYSIENLTDEGKRLTSHLQAIDVQIKEKNNLIAVLTKAKKAYISDLKSEMLSKKAGFDFSE